MNENTSTPGNNEVILQELALRLSTLPWDPRTQNPRLLVGQLPEKLPFEIPLPDGSQVLGSLLRSPQHYDIVLNTALPPEQVLEFYKERMPTLGWYELDWPGNQKRGFVHTGFPYLGSRVTFCKGTRGPALNVTAIPMKEGLTDVRLNVDISGRSSPCVLQSKMGNLQRISPLNSLPPLEPPIGTKQAFDSAGGNALGFDSAHSSATLETDADLATLANHYAAQLEKAGWTRTNEGISGPLAWHTWAFQDEDKEAWNGLFFILKMPETEHRYFLYIKTQAANKTEMNPGWFGGAAPML